MTSRVADVSEMLKSILDSSVLREQWQVSQLQGQAALIKELT